MSFDWKKIIGSIAPTIATAMGGPLAGTAVKFLSNSLLGKDNASEEELSLAIQGATPEQLGKIKEIDNDFKVEMKRLDIDVQKMAMEDTADARDMAKLNMVPQIVLSGVFITGYFSILIMMGMYPEFKVDPMTFGIITVSIPVIMQFWFGSSHGSKKKD